MTEIPGFAYDDLYGERVLRSVANLTRDDGRALLAEVARSPVVSRVTTYALDDAERALGDLRAGRFVGSAVLQVTDW
jgi:propanol-preferring alcohol dehydrogenase